MVGVLLRCTMHEAGARRRLAPSVWCLSFARRASLLRCGCAEGWRTDLLCLPGGGRLQPKGAHGGAFSQGLPLNLDRVRGLHLTPSVPPVPLHPLPSSTPRSFASDPVV